MASDLAFLRRAPLRLTFVLLALVSCTRKKPESAALRFPLTSEPPSLDPQLADNGVSVFLLEQVASTLLTYDSEHRIRNYDAKSYAWQNDGLELHVQLRPDLRWSDGEPVRICQYRDAILRALDPKVPSALADLLFDLSGARERKSGQAPESRVRLLCDDKKGLLRLFPERAYSTKLLHALAFTLTAPIRKKEVEERGYDWMLPREGKPGLSTGAFVVAEWAHDRRVVLESRTLRERDLPEDRRAAIARVELPIVKDSGTAFMMYESGALDVIEEIPAARLSKLGPRADRVVAPFFTTYMVGFSLKANPVLRDKRVRQALAFSADQDDLPRILSGAELPGRGWIPPGLLPEALRHRNTLFRPERARQLLRQAGYGEKHRLPKLKLFYNGGERHQLIMERFAANWKSRLGVDVQLEPMEWKVFLATVRAHAPDMYRYAWAAVYPDPLFFLEIFTSDSVNNFGGWSNPAYDKLVRKLAARGEESRDDEFWKGVEQAQDILVAEDPALIPAYHYVRNALVKADVKGFQFNWRGTAQLRLVRKEASHP